MMESEELQKEFHETILYSAVIKPDTQIIPGQDEQTCNICMRRFSERAAIERHLKIHKSGKKLHFCSECGKDFGGKSSLSYHMTLHTGEKPYACELCGSRYTQRPSLNYHMKTHEGTRPFVCELCGKKFQRKGLLDNHLAAQAKAGAYTCAMKKRGPISLRCAICQIFFTTKQDLDEHVVTHKHFTCPICKSIFQKKHYLTQHMKKHSPNTCDACGKTFPTKTALRIHRNMHNDPEHKPFQCEVCDARFTCQMSVKDHMQKGHQDDDTGDGCTCEICGQIVSRKFGLARHMKKHSDKAFKCTQCSKTFGYEHTLKQHMQTHKQEVRAVSNTLAQSSVTIAQSINHNIATNSNIGRVSLNTVTIPNQTQIVDGNEPKIVIYTVNPAQQHNKVIVTVLPTTLKSESDVNQSIPSTTFKNQIQTVVESIKEEPMDG